MTFSFKAPSTIFGKDRTINPQTGELHKHLSTRQHGIMSTRQHGIMSTRQHDGMSTRQHDGMLTIAIVSQKGGVGKTSLALNLAVAAELAGHTALIVDLDPQASAAAWADSRAGDAPVVVSAQAARLAEVLTTARKHEATVCIIDTAPHAESPALAAARAAHLVLVPCRASILDLRAVAASQTIAQLAGTPRFGSALRCPAPRVARGRGAGHP